MSSKEVEKKSLSKEEIEVTFECPAIYSNKFTVSVGAVVRITFIEQNGPNGKQYPRSSVAMHHQDAIKFYKLLKELLKDTEEQISRIGVTGKDGPKNG